MKHIKIKSSEVLHGGKTLDKEIKDINIRIGKIAPDGTKIATRESLGNVIIGDNINVNEKGVISIPMANGESGIPGLVVFDLYISDRDNYISVAIDDSGYLGVPIAGVSDSEFGVVKNNPPDYDWDSYINAVISDEGFIGIPRALPGGDTGVVSVVNNIKDDEWDNYIELSIDDYSQLGVPKATTNKFGVVMPNQNDFDLSEGSLSLKHEIINVPTQEGILECHLFGNKGTIIQQYATTNISNWHFSNIDTEKEFISKLVLKLLQGMSITYIAQITLSDKFVKCIIANLQLNYNYNKNIYQSINDAIKAISTDNWDMSVGASSPIIYINYQLNDTQTFATLYEY